MGICGGKKTGAHVVPPSPTTVVGSPQAGVNSRSIDYQLEKMRQEDSGKIKILLLGPGESGKSTIFKQMRILYGEELSDDHLRLYGVAARSNIVVAIRKLCVHLRNLGLEEELDQESRDNEDFDGEMSCRQAYDELVARLIDFTAPPMDGSHRSSEEDWVGQNPRAGLAANEDANIFLAHHENIRILWQVSVHLQDYERSIEFCSSSSNSNLLFSVFSNHIDKNNEKSLETTGCSQRYRFPQRIPQ